MRGSARDGSDGPASPDRPQHPEVQRPPDRQGPARADLSQRLDRLADGHPSSARYVTPGLRSPRVHDAGARRPEAANAERARGGWSATDAIRRAERPREDDIGLTGDRVRHMLDGDGPGKPGGGHRHGTNRPRKSEFPAGWADDKVVSAVQDVARHPDEVHWQGYNNRWRVTGEREGVRITAVVLPDGKIWTAWPGPGQAGTTRQEQAG